MSGFIGTLIKGAIEYLCERAARFAGESFVLFILHLVFNHMIF